MWHFINLSISISRGSLINIMIAILYDNVTIRLFFCIIIDYVQNYFSFSVEGYIMPYKRAKVKEK